MIVEQRLGATLDRLGELALLGSSCVSSSSSGMPMHAVHRRADLVAHVRQELRLRAVGLLEPVAPAPGVLRNLRLSIVVRSTTLCSRVL